MASNRDRDTVKIIDEQLKEQMKKIKVLMIVAVSVISVFLALAIGLAFLATIHCQKQPPLLDIDEEVTKHVAPLQGNVTVLNNQLIDIHAKQLNEYAKVTQQMNEYDEQTKTLNDITEMISNDLAEYAQQTGRVEDSINQNRATIEEIRNINLPSKSMHESSKVWCQKCNCRQLFRPNWASSVQCSTRWASHLNRRPKAPRGFK